MATWIKSVTSINETASMSICRVVPALLGPLLPPKLSPWILAAAASLALSI